MNTKKIESKIRNLKHKIEKLENELLMKRLEDIPHHNVCIIRKREGVYDLILKYLSPEQEIEEDTITFSKDIHIGIGFYERNDYQPDISYSIANEYIPDLKNIHQKGIFLFKDEGWNKKPTYTETHHGEMYKRYEQEVNVYIIRRK